MKRFIQSMVSLIITDITNEFYSLNTPRIPDVHNSVTNQKLLYQLQHNLSDNFHVTELDTSNAFNRLKFGKFCDPFQMKAQHFICAKSTSLISYLTDLINKLFSSTNIPAQLSTSILIPFLNPKRNP